MSVVADFRAASTASQRDDAFIWQVPAGWEQGRGAFGGLVLATMARALARNIDEDRPLRCVTATLCAPVVGGQPACISTTDARHGSAISFVNATLQQGDGICATMGATFGRKRTDDGRWLERSCPDVKSWRELPVLPAGPPAAPAFAQHFEMRPLSGLPMSGAEQRRTSGWLKARVEGARDAPYLLALADAWWPGIIVAAQRPRPMATISFALQVLADWAGLDPDAPVLHCGHSVAADGGYVLEHRELWGHDGRLLAMNQQTIAIIK